MKKAVNFFRLATLGSAFSLPFYILLLCRPPNSIIAAFSIWALLLLYFWIISGDQN